VTIIPRGRALGLTQQLPQDDRHTYSRGYLLDSIAILMGGRVAEEVVFNQRTTGAANDIERATQLARRMVCEWGMSEAMGPLSFGKREEQIFLGREIAQHRDYSESTAIQIDQEVRRIVEDNYQRARELLTRNIHVLSKIAQALLDRETLDLRDIDAVIREVDPDLLTGIPEKQSKSGMVFSPGMDEVPGSPSETGAGELAEEPDETILAPQE
jgi:cell division protease FtsH